jgi:hypothetical protein
LGKAWLAPHHPLGEKNAATRAYAAGFGASICIANHRGAAKEGRAIEKLPTLDLEKPDE